MTQVTLTSEIDTMLAITEPRYPTDARYDTGDTDQGFAGLLPIPRLADFITCSKVCGFYCLFQGLRICYLSQGLWILLPIPRFVDFIAYSKVCGFATYPKALWICYLFQGLWILSPVPRFVEINTFERHATRIATTHGHDS